MPFSCTINKERQLVTVVASDCFTFADLRAIQTQILQDAEYNPDFDLLTDLTAVSSFDLSVYEARRIAETPVFSSKSRRATVAAKPYIFGMGRLMQAVRDAANLQGEARVFYDREEALQWLDRQSRTRLEV